MKTCYNCKHCTVIQPGDCYCDLKMRKFIPPKIWDVKPFTPDWFKYLKSCKKYEKDKED